MKRIYKRIIAVGVAAVMTANTAVTSFAADSSLITSSFVSLSKLALADTTTAVTTPTLTVSKTEVALDVGGTSATVTVTATGGAEGDTVAVESKNSEIAKTEYKNNTITITPGAAGVVPVKVTYGRQKAEILVTVKGKAPEIKSFKFYSDEAKKTAITTVSGVWVNGGNVKQANGDKVNYKDVTIYTDFEPVQSDPNPNDSKVVIKTGKALIGITAADVTAAPYDGKKVVKDAVASKIVKASYKKTGEIKVSAATDAGSAKVWLMDVAPDGTLVNSNSFIVNVKAAAASVTVTDKDGAVAKKIGLAAGEMATFTLKGLLKDKKTVATDATYSVTVDEKYAANVQVDYNATTGTFTLKGVKTDNGKPVKAKVNVLCNESGKKASIGVTVTNPTSAITASLVAGESLNLHWKGDTTKINIVETNAESGGKTTDKVKVYVSDDSQKPLAVDEKGKVVFTKSKALSASYKDGVLTLKRNEPREAGAVYLVYTDSATKKAKAFKVCDVAAIVITEGGVKLA